jgi:hypothetical protein
MARSDDDVGQQAAFRQLAQVASHMARSDDDYLPMFHYNSSLRLDKEKRP